MKNKPFSSGISIIALFTSLLFGGCDHATGPTTGGESNKPKILETTSNVITAAHGGTIMLPSGSSVSIPPGALSKDTTLTLSVDSSLTKQPPSGIILSVGTSLVLSFGSGQSNQSAKAVQTPAGAKVNFSQDSTIELTLKYAGLAGPEGVTGSAAMADIVDLSGGDNFIGIPGTFNSSDNSATFTVPKSVLQYAQSISVSRANLSPVVTGEPAARFGPRIWDGSQWLAFPQGFDKTKKTLVLVHGVCSSVEAAFGNCLSDIMAAGGYEQVVGFDYDWTQGITSSGQSLADFLSSLKSAGLTQVDLEAHSLGTVVSMAAASNTDLKINNMILEGGPIDGTPLSTVSQSNLPWLTTLLNLPGLQYIALDRLGLPLSMSNVGDILSSGSLSDLQPGSTVLQQIKNDLLAKQNNINIIKVAGTVSLPSLAAAILGLPDPFGGEPNDGVIPVSSASGIGLPGPPPLLFNLWHTQLECNLNVIKSVSDAVKSGSSCTYAIFPTSYSFTSSSHSGSIVVNTGDSCSWTATSGAAWIAITSGGSGKNTGVVDFSVQANTSSTQRTGAITIADKSCSITQAGTSSTNCTYTISPTSYPFSSNGGSGSIVVNTGDSCSWTAASGAAWIAITSGGSGKNTGVVDFSVQANTSSTQRTGAITIADKSCSITQAGTSSTNCTYTISPTSYPFSSNGGSGSIVVNTGDSCSWTATSGAAWIAITSGGSGKNTGVVDFSVQANTSSTQRTGAITIANTNCSIIQAGNGGTSLVQFDGSYIGTISGNCQSRTSAVISSTEYELDFTVSNGIITVTAPENGSGSVSADGSASFVTSDPTGLSYSVSGTFVTFSGGGINATGGGSATSQAWNCSVSWEVTKR